MVGDELNYREILQNFELVPKGMSPRVEAFLSAASRGHRFLLGRNQSALALSRAVEIDGFVDDFADSGTLWDGKPVLKTADLDGYAIVVNCSMSIGPVSALARLKASRSADVLNYCDLYRVRPGLIPLPEFVRATRADFQINEAKLQYLYGRLSDSQSREVMKALAGYRLTGDPTYMANFRVRLSDQYFEDFLELPDAVFIDAGGFDGDTTEEFCRRYPAYKKVFLFEPSPKSIEAARRRLEGRRDIEFVQLALSDSAGSLGFNSDAGSASAVTAEGGSRIEATTLDSFTDERVTFIKMDLEGWELMALHGAARHIAEDHPALAISVYHNPFDYWRIYDFVMSVRDDYKVYLRHYTEGWSETVMFFVPC